MSNQDPGLFGPWPTAIVLSPIPARTDLTFRPRAVILGVDDPKETPYATVQVILQDDTTITTIPLMVGVEISMCPKAILNGGSATKIMVVK